MFEMSARQQQAFSTATNGMSANTFCHVILFLIGTITTVWLLLIFIGMVQNKKHSIYDSMTEFAIAVGIYITIGIIIYYR